VQYDGRVLTVRCRSGVSGMLDVVVVVVQRRVVRRRHGRRTGRRRHRLRHHDVLSTASSRQPDQLRKLLACRPPRALTAVRAA